MIPSTFSPAHWAGITDPDPETGDIGLTLEVDGLAFRFRIPRNEASMLAATIQSSELHRAFAALNKTLDYHFPAGIGKGVS